jgi:hypothetical protein
MTTMLRLLDANVLISAHNLYYPIDGIPEFWEWIVHVAERGSLKIPLENFEEIRDGSKDEYRDLLFGWIQQENVRSALLLAEQADERLVARVINEGYAPNLTEDEILQLGRDPFLIAYGLASPADRCVVTTEVSKPRKIRQNRRIPDVCNTLGVTWCDTFAMARTLGFTTSWKK